MSGTTELLGKWGMSDIAVVTPLALAFNYFFLNNKNLFSIVARLFHFILQAEAVNIFFIDFKCLHNGTD